MHQKIIPLLVVSFFLFSCATAYKISSVELGMTKEDVIKVMGPPVSTSATSETEYLNYALSETDDQAFYGLTKEYYVRLVNGKVDSFGRLGDFDSTQKPTVRLETEEKINAKVTGNTDLYSELKKLKELKDEGIITDEEFQKVKKELINKN